MRSRTLATAAALLAAGCGGAPAKEVSPAGDIPDDQAFVAYAPAAGFTVKVPEGWARTATGGAGDVHRQAQRDPIESVGAGAPLTVREARTTELPKPARSVNGFSRGPVPR